MNISEKISLAALVLSTVSFAVSTTLYYRQRREKIRRQEALFTIERNAQFESNLIDWPGSFEIQGVDLKTAEAEGVRKDHIAYLVLSLNTLSSIALSNDMTVYETLQDKRYPKISKANVFERNHQKNMEICTHIL
jgi:hypothetical protein